MYNFLVHFFFFVKFGLCILNIREERKIDRCVLNYENVTSLKSKLKNYYFELLIELYHSIRFSINFNIIRCNVIAKFLFDCIVYFESVFVLYVI